MKISIKTLLVSAGIGIIIASSLRDVDSQGYQYDSRGKRDPFIPLIGQGKASARIDLEDVASIADVKLEGIAVNAKGKMIAIVNGSLLKEGDGAGIVRVLKVSKKSATLIVGGKEYDIELSGEEGGASK